MVTELPPSVTFRFFDGQARDLLHMGTVEAIKSWLMAKVDEDMVFLHLQAAYDLMVGSLYDTEGVEQSLDTYKLFLAKAAEILHFDFSVSKPDCSKALMKIAEATEQAGATSGFESFIYFLVENGFFS